MVLEKKTTYDTDGPDEDGWYSRKRKRVSKSPKFFVSLHFWCLNPAVSARSVILASGTLCPTETFKSELGLPFSLSLEANHVLAQDRVFSCTVTAGPSNVPLRCTYERYNTFAFQDELGRLVRDVCRVIPGGVLIFVPSYNLLQLLEKRWTDTGIYSEIAKHKLLVSEPRSGEELRLAMQDFYLAVRNPKRFSDSVTGAAFLAVYRGKVSEGLDFADQDARAVITVGIPYPSIKDLQVDLKKKYNDQFCKVRPLLPGKIWYETQAFRALNQALGRCLRHKNDWGALILVDERFSLNPEHYCAGISKWIRRNLRHYSVFGDFRLDLTEFCSKFQYESLNSSTSCGGGENSVSANEIGKLEPVVS